MNLFHAFSNALSKAFFPFLAIAAICTSADPAVAQAIPRELLDQHPVVPDSNAVKQALDSTRVITDSKELRQDTAAALPSAKTSRPIADTVGTVSAGSVGSADQQEIHGIVLETDGTTPVVAAMVSWSQHESATQTDESGRFTLPYYTNDSLIVSAIGYQKQVIAVSDGINDLKIRLAAAAQTRLSEVVVTAMGIERDTRTLSYAIQQIDGSEVTTVPTTTNNVMSSLTGKVPGLVTTQAAGGPGSAVGIILRGHRSLQSSNNALVVVDGVPITNSFGSQSVNESGGYSGLDGSVNINPNDIAGISILKGQSAAALYGGNAANGAILITTKRGHPGKMEIHYNGGVSIRQPWLLMDYQNTYGRGNDGIYEPNSGVSWGAPAKTYPDNVKSFFHTAAIVNNSISISGGSQTLQGYGSYTNNYSGGIVGMNDLLSHTLNLRLGGRFADRLTTDIKITYIDQSVNNRVKTGEIGTAINAYIIPRDMSPEAFRHYEEFDQYGQPYPAPWPSTNSSIYTNPYWHVYRTSHDIRRNRVMVLGSARYDFTDWLNLQARYSVDFFHDQTTGKFYDKSILLAPEEGGRYYELSGRHSNQYFDILLSGKNTFLTNFSIDYNAGASIQNIKSRSVNSYANGLQIANLFTLANARSTAMSSSYYQMQSQGVFATAQLGYKEYLFLDATARNDWYSTLPAPYSFFYPSVGLTLILSDALHLPSWVSFAKVRGTYAFVGNAPSGNNILKQTYSYQPGTGNGFITRSSRKALPDLKPEQSRSFEFGTDWSFLNSRLSAHISLYRSNTYNQLVSVGMPVASGYSTRWVNLGNIQNQGIEVLLEGMPLRQSDFSWRTAVSFSKNVNTIVSLLPGAQEVSLSGGSDRLATIVVREGYSYGDIFGQVWKKNEKGQYLVDANGLPIVEANQKVGNFSPDFLMGWQNHFRYKNFTLSFQIDGRFGGAVVSGTDAYLAYYGLADYTTKFRDGGLVLPGVHEDGSRNTTEINAEKFWTTVSQAGRAAWTEFFTYDATNIRLRSVALGYIFKIDKPYLKSAQLSLVGNNLLFFYRGKALLDLPGMPERTIPTDPEMSLGAGNSQGIESGILPGVRSFGLNLKLNF